MQRVEPARSQEVFACELEEEQSRKYIFVFLQVVLNVTQRDGNNRWKLQKWHIQKKRKKKEKVLKWLMAEHE